MSVFDKLAAKWLNKGPEGVPKEGKKDILVNIKEGIEMYRKLDNPKSVEFYRLKRLREEAERIAAEKERERIRREEERQAAIDAATRAYEVQLGNENYLKELYEKYLRELEEARKNEEHVRAVAASQVGGMYTNDQSDEDDPEMEEEEFNHEEKIRLAVKKVAEAQARVDKALQDLLNAKKDTKKRLDAIAEAERMYREEENELDGETVDKDGRRKNDVVYYLRHIPPPKARPYTLDQMINDEEKAREEEIAREEARERALEEAEWSDRKREREAERQRRHDEKKREKEERRRQKEEKKLFENPPEYITSEYNPVEIDIHNVDFKYLNVVEDALDRLERNEEGPLIQKRHKKGVEEGVEVPKRHKSKDRSSVRSKDSVHSKHSSHHSHRSHSRSHSKSKSHSHHREERDDSEEDEEDREPQQVDEEDEVHSEGQAEE